MGSIIESCAKAADKVRDICPLVHCITNYVTVNDVANCILAIGASPIMADDIAEAADITSISKALVINMGTLNAVSYTHLDVYKRQLPDLSRM